MNNTSPRLRIINKKIILGLLFLIFINNLNLNFVNATSESSSHDNSITCDIEKITDPKISDKKIDTESNELKRLKEKVKKLTNLVENLNPEDLTKLQTKTQLCQDT